MKATVSRFAPSLTWVGEVRPNMDWSGYIVRLNMLTSDLTSGFSALFSHWLQVRKVGTVYLKRITPTYDGYRTLSARVKRQFSLPCYYKDVTTTYLNRKEDSRP